MKCKPIFAGYLLGCCLFALATPSAPQAFAAPQTAATQSAQSSAAEDTWIKIRSDEKYGKLYAPANIQVISRANGVPTRFSAWIKTTYTSAGAQEAIDNLEIRSIIPDPSTLSYSIALVEVNPQLRTFEYVQEYFYDAEGNILWTNVSEERKSKEINSQQSYDEDYYIALVDSVFHYGERARADAADRWKKLWTSSSPGGSETVALADTTTMRQRGDNIIYWEWMETKDKAGSVIEVKFMKKAMNIVQGTQRVIECNVWTPKAGWRDLRDELDGLYYPIAPKSAEANGLKVMRAFSKGYQYWLNRYRTDLPAAARRDQASNPPASHPVPGAAAMPRT